MNFLDTIKKNDEMRQMVFGMVSLDQQKTMDWEVDNIIPYNDNLLRNLYFQFKSETNIPTGLPIFSFFSFASAWLLKNKVMIELPEEGLVRPDLWIINLADSGASKTFSKNIIQGLIPTGADNRKVVECNIEQCASGAAFVDELVEKNNGFYFQDECAQTLKGIEQLASPTSEMKKYLLLAYSNEEITRTSKKSGSIRIDEPALTILWLNTIDSFVKTISPESIYDGFAQRFMYVMSMRDLDRGLEDYPRYKRNRIVANLKTDFDEFFNQSLFDTYKVSTEAVHAFDFCFRDIYVNHFNRNISESFFRRVLWNAWKYALIYHLLFKKQNATIDKEDMSFALKVCLVHLHSLKKLLTYKQSGYSEDVERFNKIVKRAKEIKAEYAKSNRDFKPRVLQRRISALANDGDLTKKVFAML